MKRIIVSLVTLAVIGSALFGAWALVFRPVGVQVARSEPDVAVQVFGLGTVEARVESKIGFKVSGILVDLEADVGDRVAKGAVLARLDSREQQAQVARAKAAIEQGEANLKGQRQVWKSPKRTMPMPRASTNADKHWFKATWLQLRKQKPQRQPKTRRLRT